MLIEIHTVLSVIIKTEDQQRIIILIVARLKTHSYCPPGKFLIHVLEFSFVGNIKIMSFKSANHHRKEDRLVNPREVCEFSTFRETDFSTFETGFQRWDARNWGRVMYGQNTTSAGPVAAPPRLERLDETNEVSAIFVTKLRSTLSLRDIN